MKPAEGSTLIGKSVSIRGELTGTEDLFIDGSFDGSVNLPESRFTIGPNAHVTAEINVRDLVVFGSVKGNIHASGRIELRYTAILDGDIFASRLSIEENATVRGRVELTGKVPVAAAPTPAPVAAAPAAPAPAAPTPAAPTPAAAPEPA